MKRLRTSLNRAVRAASVLYVLTLLPAAWAGPITAVFPIVNTNSDGSVTMPSALFPGDLLSFDLTGGNNGTGLGGLTLFIWTAQVPGTVQFQWSYTSCYPPNEQPTSFACDDPGADWAGFQLGQIQTQLTDTDTSGVTASAKFTVSPSLTFGWYVGTMDNLGEPGTLTVSDISFTPASTGTGTGTPEPGTLLFCLTGIAALAAARRRIVNIHVKKGNRL
jgi:hypothetical protein